MTEDLGYKDLCPAVLFNIASFVTGDAFRDLDDERSLKRPRTEEFDSDSDTDLIPETYSDIEKSSDDDRNDVDVNDGMAFDDWMERRWDREGERHFRRERALERLRDKERRNKEWRQKMTWI